MILYISLCFILVVLADPLPGKHVPLESYETEFEKEHALPTSVPNADILKTNNNPTYHKPRPPQHHGAAILAGVGGGAVPSYAPPGRSFFTPPLPPEYRNPFADKPTLRGTNTDGSNYLNRRPIPPPSLGPGHERIPIRPPGQETSSPQVPAPPPAPPAPPVNVEPSKKKPLNTPSHKPDVDSEGDLKSHGNDQANFTDFVPNSLNIPTISRILSGSNGRKEDIPDVLLRTVTAKPQPSQEKSSKSDIFVTKEAGVTLSDANKEMSTEGSVMAVLDPEMNNLDRPLIIDNSETNTRRNLQYATNKQYERNESKRFDYVPATTIGFELRDPEMSTERYHNLANVNSDKKLLKQDKSTVVQRQGVTWPFAWNIHIYLATVMFTILAVYSIFKIICYNKFTHLFTQYYFIVLHLILVFVCLMRIFYMCYDPYNINNSLPIFLSEILLHVPEIFLSIAFASTILFLLTNSINFKNTCCSFLFRSRTVIIGGGVHILICLMLHILENNSTTYRTSQGVEKRVLGLTCQIIFIAACLTLGLCYLYVYRMLKTILQKKSHTYIHGFQNLYQAIHINLATALLFVLMATLQIYGIISINQVNMTKFNWLQWGYQFSLRLIEISIIALISWVISLKVGIVASLQHEKTDGHKISGLGLFPCTAGSSNEQFESDYPAICNTNTNLHTYTLRTGKPIYESAGHHQAIPEQCCGGPLQEHPRFQLTTLAGTCDNNSGTENYSGHSSIANAGHSSSTESSNAASSQGVTNHLIKHHPNMVSYNGIESASDDHYSNCDPALQGDDPMDHEYNVIQYGSNSDFIRDIKNQAYNASSNRSSHNFKHMSCDRTSSRTNSNPRRKHRIKNKNVQNCMTMGYDPAINHHYHQPHLPDEYGNYDTENSSYHASGIQTLNNRNNSCCEAPCQGRGSQRRNSPSTSVAHSSGSQKRGKTNGFPDRPKSTDFYGFAVDPNERKYLCNASGPPQPAPRNCNEAAYSQPQDEVPPEVEGSMLVSQDGFVRFRPLEDTRQQT